MTQKCKPNVCIISAVMGTGKTEAAINYVKGLPPDKKIIVATPYKDEIDRYERDTGFKLRQPVNPNDDNRPLKHFFKKLLEQGSNIVTSHELLKRCGDEEIELIESQSYELIIDESPTCYSKYKPEDVDEPFYSKLSPSQIKAHRATKVLNGEQIESFVKDYTTEDPVTHLLSWRTDDKGRDVPPGRYGQEQRFIKNHRLIHNAKGKLLEVFPHRVLEAFTKIKVLTYLYNNSELEFYLKEFGFPCYTNFITKDMTFTINYDERAKPKDEDEGEDRVKDFKELITIWNPATNKKKEKHFVGENEFDLTVNYYKKRATPDDLASIGSDLYCWLNNSLGKPVKKKDFFYSTFKVGYESKDRNIWRDVTNSRRYKSAHVAINERATNNYRECTKVAYLANIYMDVEVKRYLISMGLVSPEDEKILDETFALSALLQVIFRSAVREYKHIDLYLPSSRMRTLLISWLNSEFEEFPFDHPFS